MNQTFDFKRFWQYSTSYISLNKSFLKLMAVFFTIPAVLSLCGANQVIVFAALSLCAALLPIRTNIPDWPPCVLLPEASVLEKFATETAIKIVYLLIPITIHAAFVIGQQSPFTDGFQIEFILYTWINIWLGTFTANCSVGQIITATRKSIWEFPYYSKTAKCSRVIDSITMVGSVGLLEFFFTGYNCWRLPLSTKANWSLFAVGMVLFILQYFHYHYINTKRFAKYPKYYELPDGSRVWEKV